jgi:hypothetical protein
MRGPVRGPSHLREQCNKGHQRHGSVVSVQVVCPAHVAVFLIIRRSWVRAPPAPPAVLISVTGEPWTGLYTDVGGAMLEPSGRIWSHRAAVERLWRTKAYGRKDRTGWLLVWLVKSMRDWTTGVAASWLAWHDAPRVV